VPKTFLSLNIAQKTRASGDKQAKLVANIGPSIRDASRVSERVAQARLTCLVEDKSSFEGKGRRKRFGRGQMARW
jgi:hypothetical protein